LYCDDAYYFIEYPDFVLGLQTYSTQAFYAPQVKQPLPHPFVYRHFPSPFSKAKKEKGVPTNYILVILY
jgi:hypothetical protein